MSNSLKNLKELEEVHESVELIFEGWINYMSGVWSRDLVGKDDRADVITAYGRLYETLKRLLPKGE